MDVGGYYEKTIINKDGIFIEDIHKIVENRNRNHLNYEEDEDGDETQLKHINIDDITSSQHYVITSSGNVENTEMLASDTVLSQFKNNFIDFSSVKITTTNLPKPQQQIETAFPTISAAFIVPTQLDGEQTLTTTGLNDNTTNSSNSFLANYKNSMLQDLSLSLSETMTTALPHSSVETTSSPLGRTTSLFDQNCIVMGE